jgi:hypothetical protein
MTEGEFEDGHTLRVVALSGEVVGDDAIVEFGEPGRAGRVHVAIVLGFASSGLAVGEECAIRFRAARNESNPARWDFVGRREPGEEGAREPAETASVSP